MRSGGLFSRSSNCWARTFARGRLRHRLARYRPVARPGEGAGLPNNVAHLTGTERLPLRDTTIRPPKVGLVAVPGEVLDGEIEMCASPVVDEPIGAFINARNILSNWPAE